MALGWRFGAGDYGARRTCQTFPRFNTRTTPPLSIANSHSFDPSAFDVRLAAAMHASGSWSHWSTVTMVEMVGVVVVICDPSLSGHSDDDACRSEMRAASAAVRSA
jgi:hypothetical protein